MEAWRRKHYVYTYQSTPDKWRAESALNGHQGNGTTKEAAMIDWAEKSGVKCWKAEQIKK